jgi:glycogen operon protein
MGDEVCRSQQGNNNAYCQDNSLSWFDWTLVERHDVVIDHQELLLEDLLLRNQVSWHGVVPGQPDWSHDSRSFAVTVTSSGHRFRCHLMANAWWEPLRFGLPPAAAGDQPWRCWIDTAQPSPADIVAWADGAPVPQQGCEVAPRSIRVLVVDLPA